MHCLVPYGPVWEHDFFSEAVLSSSSSFVLIVQPSIAATNQSSTSEWQAQGHKTDPATRVSPREEGKLRQRAIKYFPQQTCARAKYKCKTLASWVLRLTHFNMLSFISCPSVLMTTNLQRSHCT